MPTVPNFVGPSYDLTGKPASVQRTINMIPVSQEAGNERSPWVFKDAPGLTAFSVENTEVIEYFFTSHLYPIESEANQIAMGGAIPVSGSLIVWPLESVQFGATYPVSGTLDVVLKTYTDQLTETVQFGATYPLSGDLVTVLKTYTDQLTETVQFGATYPLSGTLETVLVTHPHQLTETVKFGATYPVSGTLV